MVWAFGALCVVLRGAGHRPGRHGQAGATSRGRPQPAHGPPHPRLVPREFEAIDTSALLAALTEDIVLIANAMVGVPQLCINIPILIACLAYIGWLSPVIFVCGVIFAALAIAAYLGLSARAIKELREARACQDVLVGHYRTLIDGFRELKLHRGRRAAYLAESLEPTMVSARGQMVRGLSSFAFAEGWSQLAFFGFIGVVLFAIPRLEPIGQPTLVAAVLVVLYLMGPLDIILTWVPILGRARASLQKVQALIPALERRGDEADDRRFPPRRLALRDSVSLEGVTFTYRDGHDDAGFTLGPVDLTLRPGEMVILAGGNGSGKTTLVELISGSTSLIRVSCGSTVACSRTRIARPIVSSSRSSSPTAISSQTSSGSAADGIESRACYGLERLGLATAVSVRGSSFSTIDLSQGQRRRLALLGAWLEDRPISIFDEWAANQDPSFKHDVLPHAAPRTEGRGEGAPGHQSRREPFRHRRPRHSPPGRPPDRRVSAGDRRRVGRENLGKGSKDEEALVFMGLLWGGGAFGMWYWTDHRTQRVSYRTVTIRRGDLRSTINATGTIEPEEVVDVGAQVAGLIQSFGVDPRDPSKPISYGSRVEQGTVLARLDSALFQARVDQARGQVAKAEADIEQAQAKLRQAQRELERNKKLRSRGTVVVAEQEYDAPLANYESAKATLAVSESALVVARADLEEATVNLGYTTIRSPVKGIILDRRINIGQTVVASLNAPSLFLIAKDLSRLEIWSSVNETDIGSIHEGQVVRFTVGAFPRENFEGKVSQIRLNASMTQNVVTYTVVISVDNAAGRLLPYLTARLQFEVEARKGVLLVPNAALRWQPRLQDVVPAAREILCPGTQVAITRAGRDQPAGLGRQGRGREGCSGSDREISSGRSRSGWAFPMGSSPRFPGAG